MAKIIMGKQEVVVDDGEEVKDACKELGIPFGCENGVCGTCQMEVIEGKENLFPINDKERDLFADETHRYACQCRIKQGIVRLKE